MLSSIHLTNLWLFYVLVYAIAFPLRQLANKKRGEPIQDFLPGSRRRTHNSGTQWVAQTVKDECSQQKSLDAFGLLLQYFFK